MGKIDAALLVSAVVSVLALPALANAASPTSTWRCEKNCVAPTWRCWANGTAKPNSGINPSATGAGTSQSGAQKSSMSACRAEHVQNCAVVHCTHL
jgi:hypothetical protein